MLTQTLVWDNVYGFDYSCIKDIALREPLVDTVDLKSVVTDPCMIKVCLPLFLVIRPLTFPWQHIDLLTAKKEDLTFEVPFTLRATRNDCKHNPHAFFVRVVISRVYLRCPCVPRLVRYIF